MTHDRIVRITVRGRVQGVGFRAFVEDEATLRNVRGWVRNRRDGSVEAVAAGPADAIEALIKALRRGPRAAHVDDLSVEPASEADLGTGPGGDFTFRPTL